MACKGLSANLAAQAGSEHRQSPGALPTLLSASRRVAPQVKLEIAIPEEQEQQELQAYPAEAVHVRNTFIHIASPAVDSLKNFTVSCPASHIGRLHDAFKEEEKAPVASKQVLCLSAALEEPAVPCTPEPLSMGMGLHPCYGSPEKLSLPLQFQFQPQAEAPQFIEQCAVQMALPMMPPPPQAPGLEPGMCQATMPAPSEPAPGSEELPSMGSKLHYSGECKPCAFLHAKGCDNGAMCKFCHLCDSGEKKRRQKAKKAAFKLGGA